MGKSLKKIEKEKNNIIKIDQITQQKLLRLKMQIQNINDQIMNMCETYLLASKIKPEEVSTYTVSSDFSKFESNTEEDTKDLD